MVTSLTRSFAVEPTLSFRGREEERGWNGEVVVKELLRLSLNL
jgi:hypothetical protein